MMVRILEAKCQNCGAISDGVYSFDTQGNLLRVDPYPVVVSEEWVRSKTEGTMYPSRCCGVITGALVVLEPV